MASHEDLRPYDPLVDGLGKWIGLFGVFAGCSFIYGYVYQLFFFLGFDSGWLISMYSTEALVRIGIPYVLSLAIIAAAIFFVFPKVDSLRKGILILAAVACVLMVVLITTLQRVGLTFSTSPVFSLIEFIFYGLCVGGFVPWRLKKYKERYSMASVASDLIFGIGFSCIFIPFMTSSSAVFDVKHLFEKTPLVWFGGKPVGVLLGITDSKLIVLSCSDMKTVSIYEPSDQYSIATKTKSEGCEKKI